MTLFSYILLTALLSLLFFIFGMKYSDWRFKKRMQKLQNEQIKNQSEYFTKEEDYIILDEGDLMEEDNGIFIYPKPKEKKHLN